MKMYIKIIMLASLFVFHNVIAGIAITLDASSLERKSNDTIRVNNLEAIGLGKYWAEFKWNEDRFSFDIVNFGEESQGVNLISELSFNRTVTNVYNFGLGSPEPSLSFQEGQSITFLWKEAEFLIVNGVRFDFTTDVGDYWKYIQKTDSFYNIVQIEKDFINVTPGPGSIVLSISSHSTDIPVGVIYSFR